MIKPKQLKKGDKIAIVSLSSGILGEFNVRHQLELGIKRLEELGLEPVFMPNSLKGLDFVKNNPSKRADDLRLAFENPTIKGIICAIGGDDTYKTIPYLMNEEFKSLVLSNPKVFLGFSDSTNNHLMLNQLGLVTYYGLNFLSDLCELQKEMIPYTLQGNLYDDFRVADLESNVTLIVVQIESPWHDKAYTVYERLTHYEKVVFSSDSVRELINWLNEGWETHVQLLHHPMNSGGFPHLKKSAIRKRDFINVIIRATSSQYDSKTSN